jgi:ureidoglycolate lyase
MILRPRPLTADAFAAFGSVAPCPAPGARTEVGPARNLRATASACLRWTLARPGTLPLRVGTMERHRFSSQSFIPLAPARWLCLVAPHAAIGGPDMARACAFIADGAHAITYAPDVWHHPLTALDGGGGFAVLTFLDGSGDDEEFVAIAPDITVEE